MQFLFGRFSPRFTRSLLKFGPAAYVIITALNIASWLYLQRAEIPTEPTQMAGYLSFYLVGCAALFAIIPFCYTLAAYCMGLVINYREAMAINALPWLAYGICQQFTQSTSDTLKIVALPMLLIVIIWPFGALTTFEWTKSHPFFRSAATQVISLVTLMAVAFGFDWVSRRPALQFPPHWYSQAAATQLPGLPGKEPAPSVSEKLLPMVRGILAREGHGQLQVDKAVVFRVSQAERPDQAEFGFLVSERKFAGIIYVLFDMKGNPISYELGRAPTRVAAVTP